MNSFHINSHSQSDKSCCTRLHHSYSRRHTGDEERGASRLHTALRTLHCQRWSSLRECRHCRSHGLCSWEQRSESRLLHSSSTRRKWSRLRKYSCLESIQDSSGQYKLSTLWWMSWRRNQEDTKPHTQTWRTKRRIQISRQCSQKEQSLSRLHSLQSMLRMSETYKHSSIHRGILQRDKGRHSVWGL